jgi:hypothetical protein
MGRRNRGSATFYLLLLIPVQALLFACTDTEEEALDRLAFIEAGYEAAEGTSAEKRISFAPEYEALAKEYWGTEAALEASLWLMRKEVREERRENREALAAEYADAIFEEYAASPHMDKLGSMASLFSEEQRDHYFGQLRENSPHPEVRAAAIFYPTRLKLSRLRLSRFSRLRSEDSEDGAGSRTEVDADLQLLLDEYGDVPLEGSTYGIIADAYLNAHSEEELAIGQPAPEIVGVDVDGQPMSLSEFRGKVVVLDFWGDW